jgi:hypothetical protein
LTASIQRTDVVDAAAFFAVDGLNASNIYRNAWTIIAEKHQKSFGGQVQPRSAEGSLRSTYWQADIEKKVANYDN